MEEILASIRRIIAEDGEAAPAPAAEEKPAARNDEVLELTEMVEEDGSVVSLSAGGRKPAAEPLPKRPAPEPAFAVEPAPPPRAAPEPAAEPPPPAEPTEASDRLVSSATAAASVAAMSQLSGLRDPLGNLPLGDTGRTLEDLVRELLRPMLKDWLDLHLAPLVERLVGEEIQRMSREAQSR